MRPNKPTKKFILSRIRTDKKSRCWIWLLTKSEKGYGQTWINGKFWRVHRLAFVLWKGKIPKTRQVLHRCDNPSCCNPNHLFLGSNLENILDSIAKGRWMSKLNASQVRTIRRDGRACAFLGREYGVTENQIRLIKRRKSYKWIG